MSYDPRLLALPYDFIPGGAIFDCDGTLADTMPMHYRAWCDTLASTGCPFPEELFYSWGGVTTAEVVARLNETYGVALSPEQTAVDKERCYRNLIPGVQPIRLVIDEVERLYGHCPLAVATGGMRFVVEETLRTLDLLRYFPVIVAGEDVTQGKPAPDIFFRAAERMGVPAQECVVYEDADPGLEAAHRAGMRMVDVRKYLPG